MVEQCAPQSVPGMDVLTTGRLLRRCFYVHRALMRALSGWIIAAPRYEDKHAFGYHLWEHAQDGAAVRSRLQELRGGMADANIEPAFSEALDEVLHAGNTVEFIRGAYFEVLSGLIAVYERFLDQADHAANAPEISLVRRLVPELKAQAGWAAAQVPDQEPSAWQSYIRSKLAAAGGVEGSSSAGQAPVERPHSFHFERPKTIAVDSRLRRGGLLSLAERQRLPYAEELIEQFKVFFNEFYAACILASVLYDASAAGVPFDFLYDVAHQCWDEIRHSQFGSARLVELGSAPACYDPVLYEQIESMPFLHRFCHLTLTLEPYFMARKKPRVVQYESAGDSRSRLFADVDWSDEINHVRYGHKWMEWFLKDDARDIADIKQEIEEHIAARAKLRPSVPGQWSPF